MNARSLQILFCYLNFFREELSNLKLVSYILTQCSHNKTRKSNPEKNKKYPGIQFLACSLIITGLLGIILATGRLKDSQIRQRCEMSERGRTVHQRSGLNYQEEKNHFY
jgi:hypothetical protein